MVAVAQLKHTLEVMDERARMLAELSEVLAEVGSDHALVGGIAVGYYGRLRATVDVDLLVPRRKLGRISRALAARGYVVVKHEDMVRVYAPSADPAHDEAIADLVAREANPVLHAAARLAAPATVLGHAVRIVPRGALVALKFHSAISPTRRIGDRYQDIADIDRVVAKKFDAEDEAVAAAVAEKMFPGAPEQLAELLRDLRAGRPVKI
jgi:hypothetical protein